MACWVMFFLLCTWRRKCILFDIDIEGSMQYHHSDSKIYDNECVTSQMVLTVLQRRLLILRVNGKWGSNGTCMWKGNDPLDLKIMYSFGHTSSFCVSQIC